MKLSAEILNTLKFLGMMVIFSLILFLVFSAEKKFLESFKKEARHKQ